MSIRADDVRRAHRLLPGAVKVPATAPDRNRETVTVNYPRSSAQELPTAVALGYWWEGDSQQLLVEVGRYGA